MPLRPAAIPLRPYATRPLRAAAQVVTDLLAVTWAAAWAWVAVQVEHAVVTLGSTGYRLRDAGAAVAGNLDDAGGVARQVPLVGDRLASPLNAAGIAAGDIAGAGQQWGDAATSAALPIAIALALATIGPVVIPWFWLRLRYARRAGSAAQLASSTAGSRLLALRALATAPTHRLAALHDDPVSAWLDQDAELISALTALELRRAGLDPPRRASHP